RAMISMTISCMSVARYRYVVPLLDPHAPQLPVKPGKSRQIVANETAGPRRSGQQDVSIGYLSHTDSVVRLYLQETLTFLLLTTEAVVALEPAPKGKRKTT